MQNKVIDFFGKTHGAYIHAKGKVATLKIIELLDCRPSETILEIGYGSGATITHLASVFGKTIFHGIEVTETMHKAATNRTRFCKVTKNVNLELVTEGQKNPSKNFFFDKVYAESVIAIQEGEKLENLILEIQRILKPNGVLIFNETIWLDSVHSTTAKQINDACKQSFGIIQSNSKLIHVDDWKKLLSRLGFHLETVIRVDEINGSTCVSYKNLPILMSSIYTLLGRARLLLSPFLRKEWNTYTLESASIISQSKKIMEGVIIKAYNQKGVTC